MGNLANKFEALLRGAADTATAGWNDEGVAALLGAMPGPTDPEGIPREYAAGSAEQDYRNTERADAAEAQRAYPNTFMSGQLLGGIPALGAAIGSGGVAGAGLLGGAQGFASGAGHADEGDRLNQGARTALPSALMSMAGAAAPGVLQKAAEGFKGGPPGLSPALATAGASTGARAAERLPGVNMMSTIPAPRGARGRVNPDDELIAQDRQQWENDNPLEAKRAKVAEYFPEGVERPAIPPKPPEDAAAAYVPDIPKAGKPGVPSLKQGLKDIADQDAELAREAAREPTKAKLEARRIVPRDMTNYADPRQNPALLSNDPTWREMNKDMYGKEFKPFERNGGEWRGVDRMRLPKVENPEDALMDIPKAGKVPDAEKAYKAAEARRKFQEDEGFMDQFEALKKKGKGTVEKTTVKPGGVERETLKVKPGKVETEEEDIRTLLGTMPV